MSTPGGPEVFLSFKIAELRCADLGTVDFVPRPILVGFPPLDHFPWGSIIRWWSHKLHPDSPFRCSTCFKRIACGGLQRQLFMKS